MTKTPTAGQVRKQVLFEAMDARARNIEQTRYLYNPSPECDSLIEQIARLRDYNVPDAVLSRLFVAVRELLESNLAEGEHEQRIAGFADQMANYMRGVETKAWA